MSNLGSHDVDMLKHELIGLFEHIQRIRKEIAAIRRPGSDTAEDHFAQMSDELDAIVTATEGATNSIMENVEQMEDIITEVRAQTSDPKILGLLDHVPEKTGAIFEACAFQDITGQRITKVVKSIQFIETRVNALIDMWGAKELTKMDPPEDEKADDEYQKYLHGPQLDGQGVSQADVDAMFGGSPAPSAPSAPKSSDTASGSAPAKAAPAAAKPSSPQAAPAAAKPAAAKPAAPKAAEEEQTGPSLGQDDIDKLFG